LDSYWLLLSRSWDGRHAFELILFLRDEVERLLRRMEDGSVWVGEFGGKGWAGDGRGGSTGSERSDSGWVLLGRGGDVSRRRRRDGTKIGDDSFERVESGELWRKTGAGVGVRGSPVVVAGGVGSWGLSSTVSCLLVVGRASGRRRRCRLLRSRRESVRSSFVLSSSSSSSSSSVVLIGRLATVDSGSSFGGRSRRRS